MEKIIGLCIVVLSLTGCNASHNQPSISTGTILGWNNHLYKIVKTTNSQNLGKNLGKVSYHGKVSGSFKVFELHGISPTKSIIFESSTGQYFQAVISNNSK